MKKVFDSQMEAICWIAVNAENEGHFEILREELTFNHIYTGAFFIHYVLMDKEVAWLEDRS